MTVTVEAVDLLFSKSNLALQVNDIMHNVVSKNTLRYTDVIALESILPGIIMDNYPSDGFDMHYSSANVVKVVTCIGKYSETNLVDGDVQVALESFTTADIAISGIGIFAILITLIKWVADKLKGGGNVSKSSCKEAVKDAQTAGKGFANAMDDVNLGDAVPSDAEEKLKRLLLTEDVMSRVVHSPKALEEYLKDAEQGIQLAIAKWKLKSVFTPLFMSADRVDVSISALIDITKSVDETSRKMKQRFHYLHDAVEEVTSVTDWANYKPSKTVTNADSWFYEFNGAVQKFFGGQDKSDEITDKFYNGTELEQFGKTAILVDQLNNKVTALLMPMPDLVKIQRHNVSDLLEVINRFFEIAQYTEPYLNEMRKWDSSLKSLEADFIKLSDMLKTSSKTDHVLRNVNYVVRQSVNQLSACIKTFISIIRTMSTVMIKVSVYAKNIRDNLEAYTAELNSIEHWVSSITVQS